MAEIPPIAIKITPDLADLRVVVEELSEAIKRIDARLGTEPVVSASDGMNYIKNRYSEDHRLINVHVNASTDADIEKIAADIKHQLRTKGTA